MNATTDAVAFAGVVKTFRPGSDRPVRAVDGLDLSIAPGQTVALLGPNGAGKSTTIAMLLGLMPPDSGGVELFGGSPSAAVQAGRVGSMLQEGKLPSNTRVGELVDFMRSLYPDPLPRDEVLATAGLAELAGRPVDRLSGGQTQRMRFALALAGRPDLLVLDEPTVALDVEARQEFWASMRAYTGRGNTVLFSTHYLEEADEQADRIVVLGAGRLLADGSPEQIKRGVAARTVSLDVGECPVAELEELPGVVSVRLRGGRATLRTRDSDATVAALVRAHGGVTNLDVRGADLQEAFLALTENAPRDLEGSATR